MCVTGINSNNFQCFDWLHLQLFSTAVVNLLWSLLLFCKTCCTDLCPGYWRRLIQLWFLFYYLQVLCVYVCVHVSSAVSFECPALNVAFIAYQFFCCQYFIHHWSFIFTKTSPWKQSYCSQTAAWNSELSCHCLK